MRITHRFFPLLVLLAILAGALWFSAGALGPRSSASAAGPLAPPPTPMVARAVIGGGGGITAGTTYEMHTTIGQPVVGFSDDHTLCAGFWCLLAVNFHIYMPVITR